MLTKRQYPKMEATKTKYPDMIALRVTRELGDRIRQMAQRDERNVSNWVRVQLGRVVREANEEK